MVHEGREIRRVMKLTSEGAPQEHVSVRIVKYTRTLVTPEWEDAEAGKGIVCVVLCDERSRRKRQVRDAMLC